MTAQSQQTQHSQRSQPWRPQSPFYPIVPTAEWVARIAPLGVKLLQLRLKDAAPAEVDRQIKEALAVCRAHGCTLVVNDHWEAAIRAGADFIHLGQEDLAAADLAAIRRAGLRLGLSSHDDDERATAIEAAPDYIALGPIYETTLKKMRWAPQGLERIGAWKAAVRCPLVAIGGITLERAPSVLAAGADLVSVVTDIIKADDPEARTRQWVEWGRSAA